MAHAVFGIDQYIRLVGGERSHPGVEFRLRPVGEKQRAGVRIEGVGVARPVVDLVVLRVLVLLDSAVEIRRHARRRHDTGLHMRTHGHAVQIQAGCRVEAQRVERRQPIQVGATPRVHLRAVGIRARREVDLGLRNVQERVLIAAGERARFLGVHDVVRRRGHTGCRLGSCPQSAESTNDLGHLVRPVGVGRT